MSQSVVPLVRLERLTKRFPRVLAVDDVSIDLLPGQIHALVGENGAGKTTLMNLLYGVHQPDEGRILIAGEEIAIRRPADAIRAGIALVHQHFKLVPSFTVAENLMLVRHGALSLVPDRRAFVEEVEQLQERYGLLVDPRARVSKLPLGLRQRVEVLGGLIRDAKVLILDEPTTVLPPPQIQDLFSTMRRMAAEGRAVVLITHRLAEVFDVGDVFSVMRSGRLVATSPTEGSDQAEVARYMVGRDLSDLSTPTLDRSQGRDISTPILQMHDVSLPPDEASPGLEHVSLDVAPGEIVAIAGVEGNGQRELVEVLAGVRTPSAGVVRIGGVDVTGSGRRRTSKLGLGVIPEDRHEEGLVVEMTVSDNLTLDRLRDRRFSRRGGWLRVGRLRSFARSKIEEFQIAATSERAPTRMLSGGNQQKVVLARVMSSSPRVLVAAQPTRGLDVAATRYMLDQIIAAGGEGMAVILVSSDLDHILSLSNRILVFFRGQIVADMPTEEATREQVGLHMAGVSAVGQGGNGEADLSAPRGA
jgi:simple sugar transport system ATP-binding protein